MRDISTVALRRARAGLVLLVAGAGLLLFGPLRPAAAVAAAATASAMRSAERARVLLEVGRWPQLRFDGGALTVYSGPGLAADASVAAAALVTDYPQVLRDFGLTPATAPAIVVVVSGADMARFVGGGAADPPLGAYYQGVIWLLAPSAFLPAGPDLAAAYAQAGPAAHELTHLADDLVSGGRTPRWLDEGLAQYEDWRLTGYVWVQGDNGFSGSTYDWTQLTRDFDALPDVALAYRQALAATASICNSGPGVCVGILQRLRAGVSPTQALLQAIGPARLAALTAGAAWRPGLEPQPGAAEGPVP